MTAKSHFITARGKEAERVQRGEWVTHGSVKNNPPVEAAKIPSTRPQRKTFARDWPVETKNAGLLDPAGNPLPVKAKARLVIQGQHCLDNAHGLVRADAPTAHRTAVSVFLQIVSSMGWCRSLRDIDVSCVFLRGKPREVEEPLFFERPSRGLPGIEKGALIKIVKGVLDCLILPVGGGKTCVTRSNETRGHLSNWTARLFGTCHRNDHRAR